MIVLDRRRYDELAAAEEMLADVTAYDTAKRRLGLGEDELVPTSVADALLGGQSPVRVWRQYRGLSQAELARRAGIAVSYLSNIETGVRSGSVDRLARIASALNVRLDDLIA